MNLLMSDSPPKPAKNVGEVDIPPFGVALCVGADRANSRDDDSEIVLQVRSPSGNDKENEEGTFESDYHFHNQVGFVGGATLKTDGYGHVVFPSHAPFAARVEDAASVGRSDLLMACAGSAKLKKVERGSPEIPGDCTNIFELYRPLKKTSADIWLVQRINRPTWRVKALADGEDGDAVACEILQQGEAGEEFLTSTGNYITAVVTDAVSEGDEFLVALLAGAIVRLGGGNTEPCQSKILILIMGGPTGGSLVLPVKIDGVTEDVTIAIPRTMSQLKTAFEAHSKINPGQVTCASLGGSLPYQEATVTFADGLTADDIEIGNHTNSMTGGSSPYAVIRKCC